MWCYRWVIVPSLTSTLNSTFASKKEQESSTRSFIDTAEEKHKKKLRSQKNVSDFCLEISFGKAKIRKNFACEWNIKISISKAAAARQRDCRQRSVGNFCVCFLMGKRKMECYWRLWRYVTVSDLKVDDIEDFFAMKFEGFMVLCCQELKSCLNCSKNDW